jgi:prefoldin subunit 4
MSTSIAKESDIQVTYEDQEKINLFARTNAKMQDIKEELDAKKKEVQNLEDAESELELILDEDELIPNQIGEVFVHCTQADTRARLAHLKTSLRAEMTGMEERCSGYRDTLTKLKAQLYAKFGNNINLEADDE